MCVVLCVARGQVVRQTRGQTDRRLLLQPLGNRCQSTGDRQDRNKAESGEAQSQKKLYSLGRLFHQQVLWTPFVMHQWIFTLCISEKKSTVNVTKKCLHTETSVSMGPLYAFRPSRFHICCLLDFIYQCVYPISHKHIICRSWLMGHYLAVALFRGFLACTVMNITHRASKVAWTRVVGDRLPSDWTRPSNMAPAYQKMQDRPFRDNLGSNTFTENMDATSMLIYNSSSLTSILCLPHTDFNCSAVLDAFFHLSINLN